MTERNGDGRPFGTLLAEAVERLADMVSGEVALARAELSENARRAGAGLGMILAGAVLSLAALNVLTAALVVSIVRSGVPAGWAAFGVGAVFAVAALVLVRRGREALKPENLAPGKTARNMRRDAETLKEALKNGTSV